MKKLLLLVFVATIFLLPKSALHAENNFVIDSFDSKINVQADGTIRVLETISITIADSLHGIYRDIPVVYQKFDGSRQYTEIIVKSISNGINSLEYEEIKNSNYLRLKIGNPNVLVSGKKQYVIAYTVSGGIKPFDDHDELYWNVTGNEWEVPIRVATASVSLPSREITQTACYQGAYGSKDICPSKVEDGKAIFSSSRVLNSGGGLTVVAGFPKGIVPIVTVPVPLTLREPVVRKHIILGFFGTFFPALLFLLWLWWRNGRDDYYERKSLNDPNQKETIKPLFGAYEPIVPEYDPPLGLRPGEIGVLVDEQVDSTDISASIVDLAVRGYITITEIAKAGLFPKTDYQLTRTDKAAQNLLAYEEKLLEILFTNTKSVTLTELKDNERMSLKDLYFSKKMMPSGDGFYSELPEIQKLLYTSVTEKKLFKNNPDSVRGKYKVASFFLFVILGAFAFGFFEGIDSYAGHNLLHWTLLGCDFGGLLCAILLGFVSKYMPKRTALGRDIYRQTLGYKLFVSGTEKYRQPFFEKENIFMEVLPYAMVFGVTDKLVKAMKEMQLEPRLGSWYIGTGVFHMESFTQGITDFSSSLSSGIATASSGSGLGGGGFSGGGGGGGGGGGW